MNQTIEFKKDCIMKTYVAEIEEITLTHDYKVLEDTVEGYFDISGSYKVTKSSVQKEDFMFTVPFTIALSSLIDRDSINLTINDFKYDVEKDILHLKMSLDMEYEEINKNEESENVDSVTDELLDAMEKEEYHNDVMLDEDSSIEDAQKKSEETDEEEKEDTTKEINSILSSFADEKGYYKYKIYIMRKEDTIESVAIKYNVSLDDLKEYNNLESINVGDKIIVPCFLDEEKR